MAHRAVAPGTALTALPAHLTEAGWHMVELDVLEHAGRLVVAHDRVDLKAARPPLDFAAALDALDALAARLDPHVRFDVDVKATGYEAQVAAAITAAGLAPRTLVSTMHPRSDCRSRWPGVTTSDHGGPVPAPT